MSRFAVTFRLILRSPLLVVGSLLLLIGSGSLLARLVLDPGANPVLPGMLAGCSLPFAMLISIGGLADLAFRVLPQHRREVEQQRRKQQGLCLHCGYDLRGSHDRCPECGKLFS